MSAVHLGARVLAGLLAAWFAVCIMPTSVAADTPTPVPAPTATPADQNAYYGVTPRLYDQIPFPDFRFFIGFGGARAVSDFPPPPSFMPQCSTSGISAPGSLLKGVTTLQGTPLEISSDIRTAYRDLDDLLYRLRACDYYMSVYAWNTRNSPHEAIFDFSWQTGCNSFTNEHAATALSGAALPLFSPTLNNVQRKQALARFLLDDYDEYADLYERVDSCSSIVGNLTYGPNKRRFFCNYGGFMGALLTASAVAFGKHWGGPSNSTQSQVQALGTVMIALPGLCQNASPSGGGKGKGG